ncbi:MAG: patatin-like phospholipase family protein [Gammaproteobacteria bacterium]|nr:patatin-like phospholipase family protein [Gammaproteobacteria bacterium]MDH3767277.1 patatin-like phospholipase family protein [Gammaproteobacteria bacterium]
MAVSTTGDGPGKNSSRRFGLALAGGGPLGGIYEIGVLAALDEALEGIDLHEMEAYVGVSAGALIAGNLANGFSTDQLARIFISADSREHPIGRWVFHTPAWREYLRRIGALPAAATATVFDFLRHPIDKGIFGAFSNLTRMIPTGIFDNKPVERFLADLYRTRGHTNDFRKLKRKLYVVAADLDTGESVRFGAPGHDHIPISKAIQASIALPILYPPVEIEGRYFVDGALKRTLHASVALEQDVDLLLCINPIVPYDANLAEDNRRKKHDKLTDGGLPVVLSQTFRSIIHSRMNVGLKAYESTYGDRDIVLFEPDREDSRMFFANLFSYSNRRRVCEHGYQTTRRDLLNNFENLENLFARHGIRLRKGVLEDPERHFDTNLQVSAEARERGRYKNELTNRLSDTLDRLRQKV